MRTFDPHSDAGGDATPPPAGRRSPLRLALRALAVAAVVASFAVWGYAYSGLADRDAPDLLDDRQLAATAERLCAAAVADVDALPGALDARDGPDRADQIRAATARFDTMIHDLGALDPSIERDQRILSAWLDDWAVLLGDRLRYADRIAVDADARFLITDTGVDERLDRRITRFATTNSMTSCAAPTDV